MSGAEETPVARPELIGHRGYAAKYPENTLEAIRAAIDAGARFVEFDVQMTVDHQLVLSHDPDVNRTGGVNISVLESTADELRTVPVGEPARFGDSFADIRMPTLAEVVNDISHREVFAFVELKMHSLEKFGRDVVVASALNAIEPISSRAAIISFDQQCLECVQANGHAHIGWVISAWVDAVWETAMRLKPGFLFADVTLLPQDDSDLPESPWEWAIYEITSADAALRLAQRGARFIETMNIGELISDRRLRADEASHG